MTQFPLNNFFKLDFKITWALNVIVAKANHEPPFSISKIRCSDPVVL